MRLRNNPAWLSTPSHDAPRHRSRMAGLMPEWVYPAAIFLIWIVTLAFTASQLVTVGPTLRAIPDPENTKLSRPVRAGPASRQEDDGAREKERSFSPLQSSSRSCRPSRTKCATSTSRPPSAS
jgi:hypothetical protein